MKIRKGDLVEVLAGNDRGERGTVHRVLPDKNQVVVSGVHIVKKHQRRTGDVRTQVGIIEREAPIHISKVGLVCSQCDRPSRVGYRVLGDGSKIRVCTRCDEALD